MSLGLVTTIDSNQNDSVLRQNPGLSDELEHLADILLGILNSGRNFTEFELIQLLQKPPYQYFEQGSLQTNAGLFKTHFVLHHCLYRIQTNQLKTQSSYLHITPLSIQLIQLSDSLVVDVERDRKLAEYYSDLQHINVTSEEDVQNMLDSFWDRFVEFQYKNDALNETDIHCAFEAMGLRVNVTWNEVRKQFLKLITKTHPDKGGEEERSKTLIAHYQILKQYFRQQTGSS